MKKLWYLLIPAAVIVLDQIVKRWVAANFEVYASRPLIPGLVRMIHVQNIGAAFGMLGGARWLLIAVSSAAVVAAFVVAVKGLIRNALGMTGLAMVVGGAAGNLIDRALQGYVVDMFEFEFVSFAIFNVADIFVTFGGITLCVYLLFFHEKLAGVGKSTEGSAGAAPAGDGNA